MINMKEQIFYTSCLTVLILLPWSYFLNILSITGKTAAVPAIFLFFIQAIATVGTIMFLKKVNQGNEVQ